MPANAGAVRILLAPAFTAAMIPPIDPVVSARKYTSAFTGPAFLGMVTVMVSSSVSPGLSVRLLVLGEMVIGGGPPAGPPAGPPVGDVVNPERSKIASIAGVDSTASASLLSVTEYDAALALAALTT